jgi:hypothetical protein
MTYFERHDAIVTNNLDPDKLGRLKVKCSTLLDEDQELPFWIPPRFHFVQAGGGYFGVPAKDTWVELLVPVGSDVDEVWDDQSLQMEGSGLRWVCTAYNDVQKLHGYFKANYPNRFGYAWPNGWLWIVDTKDQSMFFGYVPDEKGEPEVGLDIEKNAQSIRLSNKAGMKVEVTDQKVVILANGGPVEVTGDNVSIGDPSATEHIPLGDALFTFLNTVATGWGATHTHSVPAGGSFPGGITGTPTPAMDVPVQADIVSGKHTVEK